MGGGQTGRNLLRAAAARLLLPVCSASYLVCGLKSGEDDDQPALWLSAANPRSLAAPEVNRDTVSAGAPAPGFGELSLRAFSKTNGA